MRNLLLFILLLVGIWWFRRSLGGPDRQSPPAKKASQRRAEEAPEQMLACAHCGLVVPVSEGVAVAGSFFCSQEHARLGAQDRPT